MSGSDWSRREFLKSAAACSLAGALPATWACRRSPSSPARPNILVLFTDDQRYGSIRALGNPFVRTLHMDAIVQNGTAFTRAYIMGSYSGAVCMPSRAMLLTGRSLFHLKDRGMEIPPEQRMLPEVFREAGYTTFGTGKWHNGRPAFARCFGAGAEIFFGGMSDHWNVPVYDYDPSGEYASRTPVIPDPGASNEIQYRNYQHIVDGKHSSELFTDAAVSFLDRHHKDSNPFFMYVSYTAPHDPRTVPREYLDMYDPDTIPLPRNFLPRHPFDNGELEIRDELLATFPRTEKEVRRHLAEYYATITHLDDQIGRVLEALRRTGRSRDTLIVFAADNGLALGQHGLMGKQNLYEHSVHVPLVLSGPGIPIGTQVSSLCCLNDLFPTLCDLAGLESPSGIWGRSLAPVLKEQAPGPHEDLLCVYKDYQRAVLWDRWKLIRYRVGGTFTTQLFDLEQDPWEMRNLAGHPEHRRLLSELTTRLQDLMRRAGQTSDWIFEDSGHGDV